MTELAIPHQPPMRFAHARMADGRVLAVVPANSPASRDGLVRAGYLIEVGAQAVAALAMEPGYGRLAGIRDWHVLSVVSADSELVVEVSRQGRMGALIQVAIQIWHQDKIVAKGQLQIALGGTPVSGPAAERSASALGGKGISLVAMPDQRVSAVISWRQRLGLVLRSGLTPREVGLAVGIGAMLAITPLYGLHMVIGAVIAWRFRLNQVLIITFCNLTIGPLLAVSAAAGTAVGALCLHGEAPMHVMVEIRSHVAAARGMSELWSVLVPVMFDWFIGSWLLSVVIGILFGFSAWGITHVIYRVRQPKPSPEHRSSGL